MTISKPYFGRTVVPDPSRVSWDVRFNPTGVTTDFVLPAGACRVAASWAGPTPATVNVVSKGGTRRKIGDLAGGGHSMIATVGALDGDHIRITLTARPTEADLKYTGTLECFVTPADE